MKYVYKTQGTCSTNIELEVENNCEGSSFLGWM